MTSTSFEITRLATIPSDNNEHKVSICQLVFSPQFEYMAIPKSVAHAFLKLKVKNDSMYALLSGFANVFLDNNYLTRVRIEVFFSLYLSTLRLFIYTSMQVSALKLFIYTSMQVSALRLYL